MSTQNELNSQENLIRHLAAVMANEGALAEIFETHISWVLVTEKFAWKFKKAVHFDFLDFSSLAARQFYCQEELRLNRRLSLDLYLGVAVVTGSVENPSLDAPGTPIEYAVKMRAFSQDALWCHRIRTHTIDAFEVDALADKIAQFHRDAALATVDCNWGGFDLIQTNADDNLTQIASLMSDVDAQAQVHAIQLWQMAQHQKLRDTFDGRRAQGKIRECHGDLHGGNILTLDGCVAVFDCIEFNESLRWIDVMNDIAFIYMDLQYQGRYDLAARLLNQYLEISGDYEGLSVLRYYQVQRALIRCKVALLRAVQLRAVVEDVVDAGAQEQHAISQDRQAVHYLAYSLATTRQQVAPNMPIMITHGYSGSGKSTFAKCLLERSGAIRIRADVERKRLHGLDATSSAKAPPGRGIYDAAATRMTYDRLRSLARLAVEAGLPAIIDAACLKSEQRSLFANLAHELGVPFHIFDIGAPERLLKERIIARAKLAQDSSDADLHVLARQIAEHDSLTEAEEKFVIAVDGQCAMDVEVRRIFSLPAMKFLRSVCLYRASPQAGQG